MAQDSEDEVWEQILANANSITFDQWEQEFEKQLDLFPEDKQCEKITKEVDEAFCSCNNRQETKVEIGRDIVYVCSSRLKGCGKEIKK